MPEPLDYRNPNARDAAPREIVPSAGERAPREAEVIVAVPAEFDVCLTRSDDHAAIAAIEAALRARRIETFRADGGGYAKRIISLHVRAADQSAAAPVAAQIFAPPTEAQVVPATCDPEGRPDLRRRQWRRVTSAR